MATKKRRNGEGSVSSESNRSGYRVWITGPGGKRISKRFTTESAALAWKSEQTHALNQGTFVEPSSVTVGEWALRWLTAKKQSISIGTYENYLYVSGHLDLIASIALQDLAPHHIDSLYMELNKIVSGCTVHKVHKLLIAMLKKAAALSIVPKNIMLNVDSPRFEKKDIQIFNQVEIETILKTCYDNPLLKRKYPMILLSATTGIRLGELLGLRWCDVLFPTNEIFVRKAIKASKTQGVYLGDVKTKAGKRKIKITEDMVKSLRALRSEVKNMDINLETYVFPARTGNPISPRNMERAWDTIIRNAGIPYKNIHVLRHTHATELLALGVPIIEVSRRLGHSKVAHTLDLYGHAIPNYEDKIVDKVTQLYAVPK